MEFETLLIIGIALSAGGLVKGATGTGLPMVAIPVMAAFIGVPHAVAVMAIPTIVTNLWLIWSHRDFATAGPTLLLFLLAGVVGVGLGTWGLVQFDDRVLSLIMAGLICGYIGLIALKPDLRVEERLNRRIAPGVGLVSGTLQGATGMSGPVVVTYAHARRLDRGGHVFLVSAIYGTFAIIQAPALAGVGILTPPRLMESALALIPIVAFMWLGTRLARSFSKRTFNRVIMGVLVLMAVELAYGSL